MLRLNYRDIVIQLKEYLKLPASHIEGSFAGDIIQSVAHEFARIYAYLMSIKEQAFIDTAQGRYLERLAFLFNIRRNKAIKAIGKVEFTGTDNTVIPAGTVVVSEGMSFKTLEAVTIEGGKAEAQIEALVGGNRGNVVAGSINRLVEVINGVESVTNRENTHSGASEESDSRLRDRVYFRIRKPITSGNKYQYEEWALSYPGIGKVEVFPLWNGAGTVKVSILNEDYGKASQELIDAFKNHLDPNTGIGDGIAPIGAVVTVTTATEVNIDVKVNITYRENAVISDVNSDIEKEIREYLRHIGYSQRQTVSYAQIGYIIMTTRGVDDYSGLTVNNTIDNIRIDDEKIAVLRELKINE